MKLLSKFKHIDVLLVLLSIIASLFVTTNIALFNVNMSQSLTLVEQIFAGSIALISIGLFLIIRRKEIRFRPVFLFALSIVFIVSLVMTLVIKSPQNLNILGLHGEYWDVTFSIEMSDRASFIIRFFFVLLLGYILINVMPQVVKIKNMIFYIYLGIAILIMLIIYSLIVERESYVNFIKALIDHNMEQVYLNSVHSVFPNKNSFGVILFLLIVGVIYLSFLTKRKWPLILLPFVYIELLFTSCKAALILSLFFIACYFVFLFFYTYKKNKNRNLIALSVSLGTIAIVVTVLFVIPNTRNLINEALFGVGKFSMNERTFIWGNVVKILNASNWFTGLGYGTFTAMLRTYNYADPGGGTIYTDQAHNGYLQALGEGGILYLSLIAAIIVLFVIKAVKYFKKNKGVVFLSLSLFVIMAIYMMVEGITPIFTSTMEYFCLNALVFVPVLSLGYIHEETTEKVIEKSYKNMPYFLLSIIAIGPVMFIRVFFAGQHLLMSLIGLGIFAIIIAIPLIQLLIKKSLKLFYKQYIYFISVILFTGLFGFLISLFNIASVALLLMSFIIPLLIILLCTSLINNPLSDELNSFLYVTDKKKNSAFNKIDNIYSKQ